MSLFHCHHSPISRLRVGLIQALGAHGVSMKPLVSLVVGLAHAFWFVLAWAFVAAYSPLIGWGVELGLSGSSLRLALLPIDFIISAVLSLPAAWMLVRIIKPPLGPWALVASLVAFVATGVRLGWPSADAFVIAGSAASIAALPAAAWLMSAIAKPGAPNNSFKPNPLRGSA